MADVFISYSREDRVRADQIARGLQRHGVDVFWDSEIPPGQTWADYIEEKLTQCKLVLVLWSQHSTKSQWVREEARIGRDKGKLIPIMIDATPAPFGFGEVQAADLSNWQGEDAHPNWKRVVDAVRAGASVPADAKPRATASRAGPSGFSPARSAPASSEKKGGMHPVWWAVGGGVAALVGLVFLGLMIGDEADGPVPVNPVAGGMDPSQQPAQPAQQAAPSQPQQTQSGQQLTEGPYRDQALARLSPIQQALGSQGFQQIGEPTVGALQAGESQTIPAQLYVGYEYRIAAVCDNDCTDLDLTLFDGMGNVISQDSEVDNHPIVPVVVTGSGSFTVQVTMFACTQQPCVYAAVLYGRQS